MFDDLDEEENAKGLGEEHAHLVARLHLLALQRDELLAAQRADRTQEAVAKRLGMSRDELRKVERIALLKMRRGLLSRHARDDA